MSETIATTEDLNRKNTVAYLSDIPPTTDQRMANIQTTLDAILNNQQRLIDLLTPVYGIALGKGLESSE